LIPIKAAEQNSARMLAGNSKQQERIMPAGEVLFVIAFVMAFGVFAIVLGWADRRTRHLNR